MSGGDLAVKAVADDGMVEIQVTDNGCGISPANLEKVFSPFFTTKPVGEGTGLGLSVCYGIVESMGGGMEVSSREGHGTTFTVRLKSTGGPTRGQAGLRASEASTARINNYEKEIENGESEDMLVDDEEDFWPPPRN